LTELRELRLRRIGISDDGLEHLSTLKNLETLVLPDGKTTPEGRKRLREQLPKLK
jgi:hypothetical protein